MGFFSVILSTKRRENSVAKFLVPDFKVDCGIGLSYRPARLQGLAVRYDNPMPESTICTFVHYSVHPHSGTINFATVSMDGREGGRG